MSQEIVLFFAKKFIDAVTAENNNKFPYKNIFLQIKEDLKAIVAHISKNPSALSEEQNNGLTDSVYSVDELLIEFLRLSKKRRESKKMCFTCYTPSEWLFLHRTNQQLQIIKQKIHQILTEIQKMSTSSNEDQRPSDEPGGTEDLQWTCGVVDESKIFGWDDDVEMINNELIKDGEGLNMVGIVGMFGTGKTTLAQKIFASERVLDAFPLRLWVWVSPECKEEELIRRMLDSLGVEEEDIDETVRKSSEKERLGVLLFMLHLELLDKRYLIVFDDVRNLDAWYCDLQIQPPEDAEWSLLAHGLPKGNGSAIIVTSRKEDDARMMVGKGTIYTPKPLLDDDGWNLFRSAYEESGKKLNNDKLEKMKREITFKCNGLPIALLVAGRELSREDKKKEEEYILQEGAGRPQDEEGAGRPQDEEGAGRPQDEEEKGANRTTVKADNEEKNNSALTQPQKDNHSEEMPGDHATKEDEYTQQEETPRGVEKLKEEASDEESSGHENR